MTVVITIIRRRHELNCFSPFCLHLCMRLQTLLFYLNEKRKVKTPSLVSKLPFRRRDSELIEIKESGIDGEEIRQEQRTHCPVENKDFDSSEFLFIIAKRAFITLFDIMTII